MPKAIHSHGDLRRPRLKLANKRTKWRPGFQVFLNMMLWISAIHSYLSNRHMTVGTAVGQLRRLSPLKVLNSASRLVWFPTKTPHKFSVVLCCHSQCGHTVRLRVFSCDNWLCYHHFLISAISTSRCQGKFPQNDSPAANASTNPPWQSNHYQISKPRAVSIPKTGAILLYHVWLFLAQICWAYQPEFIFLKFQWHVRTSEGQTTAHCTLIRVAPRQETCNGIAPAFGMSTAPGLLVWWWCDYDGALSSRIVLINKRFSSRYWAQFKN